MNRRPQGPAHLIYLHIPKAGGSTLRTLLHRYYRRAETFEIVRPWKETTAAFVGLPAERRASIRLLTGHMAFGLHTHFREPSAYVTLLRRPVDRVVSHYYFARRRVPHVLHEEAKRLTLDEYVSSGISVEMDNGQVRLLSGHDEDIPFGKCGSELLEEAKRNLRDHFIVAGVVERFDESLLLMRRKLRWRAWPVYWKQNVTAGRPETRALSRDTIALIERHNELDRALYEWVAHRLQGELEAARVRWQLPVFRLLTSMNTPRSYAARIARQLTGSR